MKKITLSFLISLLLLVNSVSGQIPAPSDDRYSAIDDFILEQMENFHLPGLSACIILDSSVAWHNHYGYMDLEDSIPVSDSTLFHVFSLGKPFAAACVMQLWDDGLLGLDQNINDFLPFYIQNPMNGADSVSARMLMTHTSSINDGDIWTYVTAGDPTIQLDNFLENYLCEGGSYYSLQNFYQVLPGSDFAFHYDNYGAALNGYLVEPLTAQSFNQYAHDSLLSRLEMDRTAWFLNELNIDNLATGYSYSGGAFTPHPHLGHPAYPGLGMRTTALELSNFAIMLLNHGQYKGDIILSPAAVDSMTTVQNPNWSYSFGNTGLGLFSRDDYGDRTVWGHNGGGDEGGYATQMYFCKEENSAVVITTNLGQFVDTIVEYLFDYALLLTGNQEIARNDPGKLKVFPNPATSMISARYSLNSPSQVELSILNHLGQAVMKFDKGMNSSGVHQESINISSLPSGMYFLCASWGGQASTVKFIKQ